MLSVQCVLLLAIIVYFNVSVLDPYLIKTSINFQNRLTLETMQAYYRHSSVYTHNWSHNIFDI